MTDISTMSKKELELYISQCEDKAHMSDKQQHATKILLNSLYGAMGTPYFRMYDVHMAEGITLSGQATVSQSYAMFNDFLNDKLKTSADYVIASDTDSVVGDSIINVDGKEITIADYYDSLSDESESEYNSGKFVKAGLGETYTFDGLKIISRKIKYAMKHKVKKKMYKITLGDDFVIVTEDHALKAIDETGNLIDVKPMELNKNHKLINISSDTDSIGDSNEYKRSSI